MAYWDVARNPAILLEGAESLTAIARRVASRLTQKGRLLSRSRGPSGPLPWMMTMDASSPPRIAPFHGPLYPSLKEPAE